MDVVVVSCWIRLEKCDREFNSINNFDGSFNVLNDEINQIGFYEYLIYIKVYII